MNWFAIGGGAALLIVGINAMLGRAPKISKPQGFALTVASLALLAFGAGLF